MSYQGEDKNNGITVIYDPVSETFRRVTGVVTNIGTDIERSIVDVCPRDINGNPIVSSPLLTAKQPLNGSGNTTITFTSAMQGFVIVNDGSVNLTFTINGDTYTVKPNEKFPECFEPFTSVTIVTTGAFRCYGLGV